MTWRVQFRCVAGGLSWAFGLVHGTTVRRLTEVGPYRGTRDQPKFGSADGAVIVDVPVTFGDEPLKVQISFHEDGRIAGLFVLDPLVALPNQVVED